MKEINKKRIRVWEKMKTLEERKTENKNLLEETQKWKNEEIKENIKNSWENEKRDSLRILMFILASDSTR